MKKLDLTARVFGRLTVSHMAETDNRRTRWVCKCSCGKEKTVIAYSLTSGKQVSCGCFKKERLGKAATKHGHSANGKLSREYQAWSGAKKRCYDINTEKYPIYGGRGITVCDRWKNSFENFLADMGKCPDNYSIDRIDNDGNYEPNNCRWATKKEQVRNRTTTLRFSWNGKSMTLAEIAEENGIRYGALYKAVRVRGNPLEKAVSRLSHNT
jgi:hypothetical protein